MNLFRQILLVASLASLVNAEDYGLDCSFPIHNMESSCGDLLGDRQAVYDKYMDGCREKWGKKGAARCDANERDRLEMSRRQPQSMVVSSR
jgi:prolyl 4-hydroxylase